MAVLKAAGGMRTKATAATMLQGPADTRQVGTDNSVIASMRAATGGMVSKSSADVIG